MSKQILFLTVVLIGLAGWWRYKSALIKPGWEKIEVGKTTVKVQIRDSMEGRKQGLSGWEKLAEDEGMLFVFPVALKYDFWMKGMNFDLDFVWIKDDMIVGITEGVKAPEAGEQPVMVKSESVADKVLEVNSGWVGKNKVKVGDKVKL